MEKKELPPINIHQEEKPRHKHRAKEPPSTSILFLNCGLVFFHMGILIKKIFGKKREKITMSLNV
jgi:hypothetical protein